MYMDDDSGVVEALIRHGVSRDLIISVGPQVWFVGPVIVGAHYDLERDADGPGWDAINPRDDTIITSGDLETVAAAITEFLLERRGGREESEEVSV